ncbi:MAG: NAD(+)/NADH kinase [Acidobacteriia bacterium]|nr:NAD(+)/NADH kinase [Terriglobia bacterium]
MRGDEALVAPRRVGLAVKLSSPEAIALGKKLLGELARRGVKGVADAESAGVLGVAAGPVRAELGRHVDAVVVLGGDGTFLSVSRGCPAATPVAGINMGTLGFLTEHSQEQALVLLDELLAGRAVIDRRDRLHVAVGDGGPGQEFLVLNDVVINKAALARILTINVEIEGEFISRYHADGLIIATPTGSTAYNLSAGGPIVHPGLSAMLITPICSHTLTNRPLVVPLEWCVRVWVGPGDEEVYLTLDGQHGLPIGANVSVEIDKAVEPLSLIRVPTASFFSILHQKLKWGEREG